MAAAVGLTGALLVMGIVVMGIATSPPIEVSGIAIGISVEPGEEAEEEVAGTTVQRLIPVFGCLDSTQPWFNGGRFVAASRSQT